MKTPLIIINSIALGAIITAVLLPSLSESEPKGSVPYSNVTAAEADIWVSVNYLIGIEAWELTAKVDKSLYNQLVRGQIVDGWIEFKNVYWIAEEGGEHLPQESSSKEWGYGPEMILKVNAIHRIVPLSSAAIAKIEQEAKD